MMTSRFRLPHAIFHWLGTLFLVLPITTYAVTDDELLEPDAAFSFSAEVIAPDRILVRWNIADGYYMYRSRIKLHSDTEGVELGEPDLPPGKVKHDEFFGDVDIYRGTVDVEVPINRSTGTPEEISLVAVSQGCADIGVCYTPNTQTAELTLAALETERAAPAKKSASPLAGLTDLGNQLGFGNDNEFLDPDVAFRLTTEVIDPHTLVARWQIADGYYLYRDKFKFTTESLDVTLHPPLMPPGKVKKDPLFGQVEIFYHDAEARIAVTRNNLDAVEVPIKIGYQGCAEDGICYTPQERIVSFALPTASAAEPEPGTAPAPVTTAATGAEPERLPISEQDRLARMLTEQPLWFSMIIFFGLGLGLAFTPCVFPMIPILSSIIVGQGKHLTTSRAFVLSVVYVLAVAVTYTVAGVLAALFGANLQAAFQNPWILSSFAVVFVLLSLSMFGFYELQMPSALQSKLNEISSHQQSGTLVGVAIMGFLSALIVGPCVAAPLIGALLVISQTGDVVLGGSALFALSLGMGAPLVVIGTGAGKLLPKAGPWMDATKAVFGVLLLAVAIWMLERILPPAITMTLWAVLLIVSGVYMHALDSLPPDVTGWRRLWKGTGLILLVWGVLLLIGVAAGGKDALQPLRGIIAGGGPATGVVAEEHLPFRRIKTVADLQNEVSAASAAGQSVMLDFYADWCISCKEMEKFTFSDPRVRQALANTVLLQADVTANDDQDKALLKHFELLGPPTIIFYGQDGTERRPYRVVGYMNADSFLNHVTAAIAP